MIINANVYFLHKQLAVWVLLVLRHRLEDLNEYKFNGQSAAGLEFEMSSESKTLVASDTVAI